MARFVALLRGINVGGHRKVPMADLRMLADRLGLADARTYVASGNLVFASSKDGCGLEGMLEQAIASHFGFAVDVILRTAAQWQAYCASNPFPAESEEYPERVMITIGKQRPTEGDLVALRARARGREKVALTGDSIWIYFAEGAGRSKLGAAGKGVWTTRNWRTAVRLREMIEP